MMVNGKTTKHLGRALTIIIMGRSMKENGWTISSMAMVLKLGLMVANMKDITT